MTCEKKIISGFLYMLLKSRDYVFKMSIFKKLSIVLYMYVFILKKVKSAFCSVVKFVKSVNARVSDLWICSFVDKTFKAFIHH